MAHYGKLGEHRFSESEIAHDIRGANIFGSNHEIIGKIDDVVFEHDTMEIRYVIVESGGWLKTSRYLLPADSLVADEQHPDAFVVNATKEQIESLPPYDEQRLSSEEAEWMRYNDEYKKAWKAAPVQHREGSDRDITPDETEMEETGTARVPSGSRRGIPASELFPERLADKFGDPAPGGGKVTLRPKAAARIEDAAAGTTLLKPHWWENLSNLLRQNRGELQARCPHCQAEKRREVA